MAGGGTAITAVRCPKCDHPGAIAASFYALEYDEDNAEQGHAFIKLWCPKCGLAGEKGVWPKG